MYENRHISVGKIIQRKRFSSAVVFLAGFCFYGKRPSALQGISFCNSQTIALVFLSLLAMKVSVLP
jgi:hypothetical protein